MLHYPAPGFGGMQEKLEGGGAAMVAIAARGMGGVRAEQVLGGHNLILI